MNPLGLLIAASIIAPPAPEAIRSSIEKGIARLEAAATNYTKNRSCFSCHHQAVPLMALTSAKELGFKIRPDIIKDQREFSLKSFQPRNKEIREGRGVGGGNTMAAYGLYTLQIAGHDRDETNAALVSYLLTRQDHLKGFWPTIANRPPSDGSKFTATGLAMECLKLELPNVNDETEKSRISVAMKRGLKFLIATQPETTEDSVFRLRGLVAGGADEEFVVLARDALRSRQRADGGWGQLQDMDSDAYATATVLVALRKAGLRSGDFRFQRGLKYLYLTQDKSGGWVIQTRSRPIQTYFDNGDPGGKSQFISTAATGWAVLALLQSLNPI